MNTVEIIYKNIDKLSEKKFKEYIKTITKDEAKEFKKDLHKNKGLEKYIDIMKISRCMRIADISEK